MAEPLLDVQGVSKSFPGVRALADVSLRVHPSARLSLQIAGVDSASELAAIAAAVGLASNLAAVRALATDGIQRGHMALHARSVALAAGAGGAEVEGVAAIIVEARDITVEAARRALVVLRAQQSPRHAAAEEAARAPLEATAVDG